MDTIEGHRHTFLLGEAFTIWNRVAIVHIFHAAYYRDTGCDTGFWDLLLEVYKQGRYPCGWQGEKFPDGRPVLRPDKWPDGKLLVW